MIRRSFHGARGRPRAARYWAWIGAAAALVWPTYSGAQSAPAGATPDSAIALTSPDTELAPTSAVPWNPARPVPERQPWEAVLDAPLTVASIPVRLVGAALRAGMLRAQEDQWVAHVKAVMLFDPPWGLGLRPADLGDRTGFGGGVVFSPPIAKDWLHAELLGSTLRYGRARVALGPPELLASYRHDWRPQEAFFRAGDGRPLGRCSNYSTRARRAELRMHVRDGSRLRREMSTWFGERRVVMRRGRDRGRPSLEDVFPQLAAGAFDVDQDHVVTGGRLALDTRAGHPHWSRGWQAAAQWERYGAPRSGAGVLFPGRAESPGFTRLTLQAQAGTSFHRDPRTLRFAARVVDTHAFDPSRPPALFDLPGLGGSEGLAGFEPGRFHGPDLVLARVAYVFPLAEHSELLMSSELGGVFDDVWRGARLDRMEGSHGISFRVRSQDAPLAAVGVHWSREQVRFGFSLGGVE